MSQEDKEHALTGRPADPTILTCSGPALRQWIDLSVEPCRRPRRPSSTSTSRRPERPSSGNDQARSKLDRYLQARLETAGGHYDEQIGQIDSLQRVRTPHAEDNTASLRSRIAHELTKAEQRAKGKLDHELWLSESVAQATKEQVTRDLKEFRSLSPVRRQWSRRFASRRTGCFTKYGQMRLAETEDRPASFQGRATRRLRFSSRPSWPMNRFRLWLS
jgi:hypothetical protein